MSAVTSRIRPRKLSCVKKTFNLSGAAAKHADELAYVRGFPSTSTYLESLIADAYTQRQRNMVRVKLVGRKSRK